MGERIVRFCHRLRSDSIGCGAADMLVMQEAERAAADHLPHRLVRRGRRQPFRHDRRYGAAGTSQRHRQMWKRSLEARLLLMACLMKFGSLPPAADPDHPTSAETAAVRKKVAEYQRVFDGH